MKTIIRLSIHKFKHRFTSISFLGIAMDRFRSFLYSPIYFVFNIYYSYSDIFGIKNLDPMRYINNHFWKGRNTSSAGPIPDCSANISSCNFRGIRPTLEHSDHKQQSSIWSTPCFYRQGKCQYFSQIDHAPRSHQRFLSAKPGACQQITIQICVISDINIICVSINYITGVGCHM